ncbi:MAG TPA: hypothetical protein VH142_02540 [Polyangiaceae bacterium]|nr:hypothetical protein [Polyangiaceae bacterium]
MSHVPVEWPPAGAAQTGDPPLAIRLRTAGALDLGDWLSFLIEPDADMPTIKNDGLRFRGEAQLAGKLYGDRFGIDTPPRRFTAYRTSRSSAPCACRTRRGKV